MTSTWLPVLVVLAAGLVSGLMASRRLRSESLDSGAADEALRLVDLKRRRDTLYRQIRSSEEGADRDRLELSAAYVLRQLDEMRGEAPEISGESPAPSEVAAPPSADPTPAVAPTVRSGGRPMMTGFLYGAALVALVGVLLYWALSDAQPQQGVGEPAATMLPDGEHPAVALPPDVQAEIDILRNRLAADPSDLLTRKQLGLALLAAESFMEAFQLADGILAAYPDDPDGLYIQGMVRLTMGQLDEALPLLEGVLDQYPNHIMALAGRGMVFFRRGDAAAAVLIWERALEAAGGSHPDLERLLSMARGTGGGPAPAQAPAPTVQAPSAPPTPASPPADSYSIEVVIAEGVRVPPTATLFVFLRADQQGPPSAVKRIESPTFPARLSLGPADTMLGRPLPSSGTITVRLDADGSASTRGEDDLLSEIDSEVGSSVRVVLGE